ncbi:sulfatase-like hydrolase/transferase [Nocardioides speluncae]|uniref:sulfatase-like hydrolase/transferase n=1 Tax=Nocardioides speluncae TaxID=2670337 RepID=UPI000D69408E|nr:sulfatase-like hydrolase/transferase [Nocardioides speluncae]
MRTRGRLVAALVVGALAAGCGLNDRSGDSVEEPGQPLPTRESGTPPSAKPTTSADRPNIVMILLDDFSMDLLQTMPTALDMQRRGASYAHSFVVDSLCCVSRASIFTGQYPHQTGVLANVSNMPNAYGPIGGYEAFDTYGNGERAFNVRLQQSGYTTGFVGKYLNQYELNPSTREFPDVPEGWDDFQVMFGSAYNGWGFDTTYVEDREVKVREYPRPDEEESEEDRDAKYAATVQEEAALEFLEKHRDDEDPYFLEISTYGPHSRVGSPAYPEDGLFPAAFQDRRTDEHPGNCGAVSCNALNTGDLPGFGDERADNAPYYGNGKQAPAWRRPGRKLSAADAQSALRSRAQMVQSIDRMIGKVLDAVSPDTYVVLTSDNGFHIGQHGLIRGKGTPYDSDTRVPLIVVGPGVKPGVRQEVVSNIDLAPTFEEMAGLKPATYQSGISLVPTLTQPGLSRQDYAFFEHTFARSLAGDDPDAAYTGGALETIPSYVAVRSRTGLLVRLDLDNSWTGVNYAYEYYDYRYRSWEKTNTFNLPENQGKIRELMKKLDEFDMCVAEATRDEPVSDTCRKVRAGQELKAEPVLPGQPGEPSEEPAAPNVPVPTKR